jgi:chorismate synthase
MTAPRPGHADLTGVVKYGYNDLRPSLERASARETTMRVAVGAICKQFLAEFGIVVGGYVRSIGEVNADFGMTTYKYRFDAAETNDLRCPDVDAAEKMRARINACIREKDTLGGVIEIVALNAPVGLGSFAQWDTRLEAKLAQAILSVQAIKGVEIGDAFENARLPGTQAHDAVTLDPSTLNLQRPTNRAGGIEGGISNGEPIVIRAAMKPIASTLTPQKTVDLVTGEETATTYERSDFCPVPRAVPVLEAVVAIMLADALIAKLGGDSIAEMKPRFEALKEAKLSDIELDNRPHVFW